MLYSELFRRFNTIIDIVSVDGNDPITDREQYNELVNEHTYIYAFDDYYIGVKISYQIKDNKVEPLYMVNPVVLISGKPFAVTVPSDEVTRMNEVLFTQWKKGDADFLSLFPSENLLSSFQGVR